jgi:hypothetical protein
MKVPVPMIPAGGSGLAVVAGILLVAYFVYSISKPAPVANGQQQR